MEPLVDHSKILFIYENGKCCTFKHREKYDLIEGRSIRKKYQMMVVIYIYLLFLYLEYFKEDFQDQIQGFYKFMVESERVLAI